MCSSAQRTKRTRRSLAAAIVLAATATLLPTLADALVRVDANVVQSTGEEASQAIELSWTAPEEDLLEGEGFSIERAQLGGPWAEIGRIQIPQDERGPREVQLVTSRADEGQSITAGSFRLSLQKNGLHDADTETPSKTGWIPFDASAATVETSLESLGNVGDVRVARSGPDAQGGYQWTVTFMDAAEAYPALQVVASTLDALASGDQMRTVSVSEIRPGAPHSFACLNNPDKRYPQKDVCSYTDTTAAPQLAYMYRVRAILRNDAGERVWSPYSDVSRRVSLSSTRSLAHASSISLVSVTADSFRVRLAGTAPAETAIQLQLGPQDWVKLPRATSGDTSDFVALGLAANTEYTVRALVASQDGTHTDTKVIRTAEASRTDIELTIAPDGPESVQASWRQTHERVTEFQVQARELKDGRKSTEYLDGDDGAWTLVTLSGLAQFHAGRAEVQTITTRVDPGSGAVDGGAYRLAFRDARSPSTEIAHDATASTLQAALEALGITAKSVKRSAPTAQGGYTYSVVFDPIQHPGNQPPLLVVSETLTTSCSGSWSGVGGPVAVSTIRDGVDPDFASQTEALHATVNDLTPYTWYAFRIREIHVSTGTGRLEAGAWSDPVGPIRTAMATNTLVDAPVGLDLQDARVRALADVIVEAGQDGLPARNQDPHYAAGVGVGGGNTTGGVGDVEAGFAGGPGLVVIRPRSFRATGIAEKTWPARLFSFTGATQVYELPSDALIDQLDVKLWGAGGGSSSSLGTTNAHGGAGGFVHAVIDLASLTGPLHVRVGGGGAAGGTGGQGGWNGGGQGGTGDLRRGGGGGGASTIFLGDATAPIAVAAGGGGAGGADYCCANGGDAHADGAAPASDIVLLGLPAVDPNTAAFAAHENKDLGLAPDADYSVLASPGLGGSDVHGGQGGTSGSYISSLRSVASSGMLGRGGDGGSGHEGGGGGGGGIFGGGGGGSGVEGGGGGGGASFVLPAALYLARTNPETPFVSFGAFPAQIVASTPQSVSLVWSAQDGARYIVEIAQGLGNEDFAVAKHVSGANEVEIDGLEPDTVYAVRVRAVSARGGPERVGETRVLRTPALPAPVWSQVNFRPLSMPQQTRLRTSSEVDSHLVSYAWEEDLASGSGRTDPRTVELQAAESRWTPRHGHSATLLDNGRIYLFGGFTDGSPCALPAAHVSAECVEGRETSDELWVFDPDARTWELETRTQSPTSTPPSARALHAAAHVDNRLYIFGGLVYSRTNVQQTVGVSSTTSVQRDASGRIASFSVGSRLSTSGVTADWARTALDDFFVYDPTQPALAVIESTAELDFASASEGKLLVSAGSQSSLTPANALGEDLCVSEVQRVVLNIEHPCPNSLRVWLRGPGSEGRNVDDTYGTLLMDRLSSAHEGCPTRENSTTFLVLQDNAAQSFRDAFALQNEGVFRPASPLSSYAGILYSEDAWSVAIADEELNGDASGALVSWKLEVTVHPCAPSPTWTQLASGPPARYAASSMSMDGQVFVFGGKDPDAGVLSDFWVYDVALGLWEERGQVDTSDFYTGELALPFDVFGHLFIYNATQPGALQTVDMDTGQRSTVLTTTEGASATLLAMPAPRIAPAVAIAGDSLWVFGGHAGVDSLDDIWQLSLACVSSNIEVLQARCYGVDVQSDLACVGTCTAIALYRARLCRALAHVMG